jgi:hypothetical protein
MLIGMQDVNPYAAPEHDSPLDVERGGGIWRDGDLLVMRKGATLPDVCVKCNGPAEGRRLKYLQLWHEPIYFLLWPLAPIILPFVMQSAKIDLGVCQRHLRERDLAIAASVLTFFIGFASIIVALIGNALSLAVHWRLLIFLSAGIAMLFVSIRANIASTLALPRKIDRDYVWLKQIDPDYLAQYPPVADAAECPPPC